MSEDIVIRLRVATVADTAESLYQLMTDAADEVENLRAELEECQRQYRAIRTVLGE